MQHRVTLADVKEVAAAYNREHRHRPTYHRELPASRREIRFGREGNAFMNEMIYHHTQVLLKYPAKLGTCLSTLVFDLHMHL